MTATEITDQTTRTFPIRLAPMDGESLDSWLEAMGCRLGTAWGDVLQATGLPAGAHSGTTSWLTQLTQPQSAALSQATGQDRDTLAAMTLARYDGTALRIRPDTATLSRAFPWSRQRFCRFCPHCLNDTGGRWQLFWRLGWAFACPIHCCLLVDQCPVCGQRQRQRPTPTDLIPKPGFCAAPSNAAAGRAPARCAADLRLAEALAFPSDHPVLTYQRIISDAIEEGTTTFGPYHDDPVATAQALADIRAVAGRVLAYAGPDDLEHAIPADLHAAYSRQLRHLTHQKTRSRSVRKPGLAAPAQALTTAVGVSAALRILAAPTSEAIGDNMRWLVTSARQRGLAVSATNIGWAKGTTEQLTAGQLCALEPLLKPTDQLRYRTGSPRPTRPTDDTAGIAQRAAKLPATLWPAWAVRMAPSNLNHQHLAQALPCAVLLVNTKLTLTQATTQMSWPGGSRALSHVLQRLQAHNDWKDVRQATIRLADYLDTRAGAIDYQRRRSLDYRSLLPLHRWQQIVGAAENPSAHDDRLAAARCYLYSMISANPATHAPWFIDTKQFAAAVADFPAQMTATVAQALQTEAQAFLRHNNIGEPVTWHPPTKLLHGLSLPGTDPRQVNTQQLHHLLGKAQPLTVIARQLDTPVSALRYTLTVHPPPAPPETAAPTLPAALENLRGTLTAQRLTELYEQQHLSLRVIAARYGTSRQTVARLAHVYGIELRAPQRPRQHDEVNRDWLYTEYAVHGRTLPELAQELGMSTTNMARWARHHRIERRRRGKRPTTTDCTDHGIEDQSAQALQHPR